MPGTLGYIKATIIIEEGGSIFQGYIECSEHGKQIVILDTKLHSEYFTKKTTLCP